MPDPVVRRREHLPTSSANLSVGWHVARWRHATPGPRGAAIIAGFAVILALPLHRMGLGDSWSEATRIPITFATVMLPFLVGREVSASDELEFWLLHKGVSPADWALAKWRANLIPIAAAIVLWISTMLVAAVSYGARVSIASTVTSAMMFLAVAILVTVLLYGLGATGSAHAPEIAVLLIFSAVMLPLLANEAHVLVRAVLRYGLPPVVALSELRGAVDTRDWRSAAQLALHVGTWSTAVMLASSAVLSKRRLSL